MYNDYPLVSEKLQINHDMLSNYSSNIPNDYGIKIGDVDKLVPNFGNKSRYVLHYKNLQFYLSLGMKLTKFHRILKFKQSDLLKIYTENNTNKRKNLQTVLKKIFLN